MTQFKILPIPGRPKAGPSPVLVMAARLAAFQAATAELIIARLRNYPAPLANQQYIRTFALHDAWGYEGPKFIGDSLVTTIINDAVDRYGRYYARLVQGDYQTPIHQGRWETIYDGSVLNRALWNRTLRSILRTSVQANRSF